MPASSSESSSVKLTSTTSSMSLTPTNSMVSGPVTKIDPIASELEGMIETPTDLTSVGSKVASVKPNLIPTESASSILASEGSVPPHQESVSELSKISSYSSSKITPATSSFASEPTSLAPVSTHFETYPISKLSASVIEEASSSSETDIATSTAKSGNTDVLTEITQSYATNSAQSSSSESTNIEENISTSAGLNDGSTNSFDAQASKIDRFSSAKAEFSVESQTVPHISTPALSSTSNSHDVPAAASGFVQKEIMIEIQASKDLSETSSTASSPTSTGTEQPIVQTSPIPSTETQTSSYEEVTSSASLSDGVVSSFDTETASLSDSTASSHHITAPASEPADSTSDSDIINSSTEAVGTVGDVVDLHDEL